MNSQLSENTQAILLLTQPLTVGKSGHDAPVPLTGIQYHHVAEILSQHGFSPSDLLGAGVDDVLGKCLLEAYAGRIKRLLGRGFLLSLAVEQWVARAIWVVSRDDSEYPSALRQKSLGIPPPVLYGRGDRRLLGLDGFAVAGPWKTDRQEPLRYSYETGTLAAQTGYTIVTGTTKGIAQAAIAGAWEGEGSAVAVLSGGLSNTVLDPFCVPGFAARRFVACSPYDPSHKPKVEHAIATSTYVYAFAHALLVVEANRTKGPTWRGVAAQLAQKSNLVVFVRQGLGAGRDLAALQKKGALRWPEPRNSDGFRRAVEDALDEQEDRLNVGPLEAMQVQKPPRTTAAADATDMIRTDFPRQEETDASQILAGTTGSLFAEDEVGTVASPVRTGTPPPAQGSGSRARKGTTRFAGPTLFDPEPSSMKPADCEATRHAVSSAREAPDIQELEHPQSAVQHTKRSGADSMRDINDTSGGCESAMRPGSRKAAIVPDHDAAAAPEEIMRAPGSRRSRTSSVSDIAQPHREEGTLFSDDELREKDLNCGPDEEVPAYVVPRPQRRKPTVGHRSGKAKPGAEPDPSMQAGDSLQRSLFD